MLFVFYPILPSYPLSCNPSIVDLLHICFSCFRIPLFHLIWPFCPVQHFSHSSRFQILPCNLPKVSIHSEKGKPKNMLEQGTIDLFFCCFVYSGGYQPSCCAFLKRGCAWEIGQRRKGMGWGNVELLLTRWSMTLVTRMSFHFTLYGSCSYFCFCLYFAFAWLQANFAFPYCHSSLALRFLSLTFLALHPSFNPMHIHQPACTMQLQLQSAHRIFTYTSTYTYAKLTAAGEPLHHLTNNTLTQ